MSKWKSELAKRREKPFVNRLKRKFSIVEVGSQTITHHSSGLVEEEMDIRQLPEGATEEELLEALHDFKPFPGEKESWIKGIVRALYRDEQEDEEN